MDLLQLELRDLALLVVPEEMEAVIIVVARIPSPFKVVVVVDPMAAEAAVAAAGEEVPGAETQVAAALAV